MAAHQDNLATTDTHPMTLTEAVRVLIGIAVAAGWVTAQEANVYTVGATALGVVVSVALTWWTTRRATPVARPRGADGAPLVPAPAPTQRVDRNNP